MLSIHPLDPAEAVTVISGEPRGGLSRQRWKSFCRRMGLLAFTADENGTAVGFCLAASEPQAVQIFTVDGDFLACRLLLDKLVKLAGERDVSAWLPAARRDLLALVEEKRFVWQRKAICDGVPCHFYLWEQNQDDAN